MDTHQPRHMAGQLPPGMRPVPDLYTEAADPMLERITLDLSADEAAALLALADTTLGVDHPAVQRLLPLRSADIKAAQASAVARLAGALGVA